MKTKILGCIVGLGVVTCLHVGCTQPPPPCLVEDASAAAYATMYVVDTTKPVPPCATSITVTGELIGMSFFHPEITASDGSTTFDPNIGHVAIQGNTMGTVAGNYGAVGDTDATPGDALYAYGRFKQPLPDANNLCYVTTDQGITGCAAAAAACSTDEDCCNGQCNVASQFTCQSDSDCPTGTTCDCAKLAATPATCSNQQVGGTCKGPNVCAPLLDNMTAQQTFSAATDSATGKPTIGMPCNAKSTTPASCVADGAACTAADDCCSGACTMNACAAGMDTACAGPPMSPTTAGVVCDPTMNKCVLGCRGMGGNSCDATFTCSSKDTTIGSCSLPAESISYVWSNVQIYTTADAQGTQYAADLAFTQTVNGAACTINYKAIGMWPAVSCAAQVVTGTTDITAPALYGPNGTLNGTTLILDINDPTGMSPLTLPLSGTTNAASQRALFAAIEALWPLAVTAGGTGGKSLVITDTAEQPNSVVVEMGTANAALGLTGAVAANVPNDDMCNPCSEAALGRPIGSGINVAFPTHCDPNLLNCVLVDQASYAPNAADIANGVVQAGPTKPATSIPQVMPLTDVRIPSCPNG